MKKRYFDSIIPKLSIALILLGVLNSGCSDSFFDKQPLDAVSDATFWKTEADAKLALASCYSARNKDWGEWTSNDWWSPWSLVEMEIMAGNGSEKEGNPDRITDGTLTSTNGMIGGFWSHAYRRIATCNNFLDHMASITMDENQKAIMISEVRTIRAYEYFNLAFYFGDVPLVQHIQTLEEANSVSRNPRADVWAFAEKELKESALVLPKTRPDSENGRMTAGAALAILGRLQMAEKKWSDAATSYKTIIDNNTYTIDPKFKEMFWEANELGKEIILSSQYQSGVFQQVVLQFVYPEQFNGWHQFSPYNELVKEFECTDGKTIATSPLYDKNDPYNNRDPRLDGTVLIPERGKFKGVTYTTKPGTSDAFGKYPVWSGYGISKFMDEGYSGSLFDYGGNWTIIRYSEVLLSYLESKLESGAAIDQALLDATINKVRGRAAVNMPAITTTDATELRNIVRKERRVEFAFEGLRYYDILRWGIAADVLNGTYHGMKLTNDPANYTTYPVDAEGYFVMGKTRAFKKGINELWPIPQSERDINKNLTQNTGY